MLHPTPKQDVLRHETPKKALKVAPTGFEVFCTDHLLPSHASAKVWFEPPLLLTQLPAPVQDVSLAQDTSWKTLARLPEGLGVLCNVQVVTPLKR